MIIHPLMKSQSINMRKQSRHSKKIRVKKNRDIETIYRTDKVTHGLTIGANETHRSCIAGIHIS